MNPIRIALTLLVLAAVASAGHYNAGTGTGSAYGTGTGRGIGTGTGAGLSVARRLGPVPEGGILAGIGRSVNSLHPSNWLNKVVEHVPNMDSISFGSLVRLPVTAASTLLKAIADYSGLNPFRGPLYVPPAESMNMYLIKANGNVSVPLTNPSALKNYPQLSTGEVTIFISGIASNSEDPSDAVSELVEAYRARYQLNENQVQYTNSWDAPTTGNLIVIDLGNHLNTFKKWVTCDIEAVGQHVGKALVEMSEFIPYHQLHLIGHSIGAHVAGSAARYFTQEKSTQLRRVTGLDPSKIFTKQQQTHSELNRGVADLVDVIHTTSYGAGTETNGDVDFYPNGVGSVPSGTNNILEAFCKAISYYAETVRPGNERNFMAVECNSMKDYENHKCHGIRIPMGYDTPQDAKGNYILRVNSNAPYGRNARNLLNNTRRSPVY